MALQTQDPNNPAFLSQTDPNLLQGSLQGTMTGDQVTPQPFTPPSPPSASAALPQPNFQFGATGSQFSFSNYMQMAIDRMNAINPMLQQRQLLLKHLYDQPLSPQDIQKLPQDLQQVVATGDKQEIEMATRLLNDQISGRQNTMNQALQFLTQGYQASVQDLETQRQQKMAQAEFIIKNTPSAVLRKTYSAAQLDALGQALGMPTGTLSDPNFKTDKDIQLQSAATSAASLALSREALSASRYATAVQTTIKSFYPSGKSPIQAYGVSSQAINRIDTSYKLATDPKNQSKGVADLDLVDAYIQIARGGQAITEAQVEVLLSSLGIKARFDVAAQKITGTSILDDGSRKAISDLAHNTFNGQQVLAQKATDQINKQLTKQGIPSDFLLSNPDEAASFYNISETGGNTTTLIGPDGLPYSVPNDQVDAFIAAGGHQ